MISHAEAQELIALYALGTLDAAEARKVEEHLETGCGLCREELEAFERVAPCLALDAAPVSPPDHLRARMLARIASDALAHDPVLEKDGFLFVRPAEMEWMRGRVPAVEMKVLAHDRARAYVTRLVRMAPGAVLPAHRHAGVEESYVIAGDLLVAGVLMRPGDYCRAEVGSIHRDVRSEHGCLFLAVSCEKDEILA